jgi:Glyoxalase-like domain
MPTLDHLAIIAPTLEEGVAYVETALGVPMAAGGKHREMGTHNRLLRLGDDVYLEAIAVDPEAPPPARPRWFGLDDFAGVRRAWDEGRRLQAWVARTDDINGALAAHGAFLGAAVRASRGDRSWTISIPVDGALPLGGLAPSLIAWGAAGSPAPSMPDVGARLASFEVETPNPETARALFAKLNIADPPSVRLGAKLRYRAEILTSTGSRRIG